MAPLICSNTLFALLKHVRAHKLGGVFTPDTGFALRRGPDTLRCPDVAFVSAERLARYGVSRGMMEAPPDLAIEILSPSNSASYVRNKLRDYFAAGVRLVWVIDPRTRSVTGHAPGVPASTASETDTLDAGDVVPAFQCSVTSFFEGVPLD